MKASLDIILSCLICLLFESRSTFLVFNRPIYGEKSIMGNRGIFCLFERMFQGIISCLSAQHTIQFWLLFAQNFIKVHGNNTALT